jgi:hypothetical protein
LNGINCADEKAKYFLSDTFEIDASSVSLERFAFQITLVVDTVRNDLNPGAKAPGY